MRAARGTRRRRNAGRRRSRPASRPPRPRRRSVGRGSRCPRAAVSRSARARSAAARSRFARIARRRSVSPADHRVVDALQRWHGVVAIGAVRVHADDDLLAALDRLLVRVRGVLDLAHLVALLDRRRARRPSPRSSRARRARARSMSAVSDSIAYAPPSGSMVSAAPVSSAMICCVRSAVRADSSLGSASASSYALVCSDCVPPSTAASASIAVRTMLLSGCCAVSVDPIVWVWKRSASASARVAPKRSRMTSAQIRRAARNFATSSRSVECAAKKNDSCGANASTLEPGLQRALDVLDRVGERERELLHRVRARPRGCDNR